MAKLVEWHGKKAVAKVRKVTLEGMWVVVLNLEKIAKKKVSIANSPRKRVGGRMVGMNPSTEGNPPKAVTGTLRNSISGVAGFYRRGIVGILGVKKGIADAYAARLEFGFKGTDSKGRRINQGPRPYLRPTIASNRRRIMKWLVSRSR